MEQAPITPEPSAANPEPDFAQLAAIALSNPAALAEAISSACPSGGRRDGWTPFTRRLFLEVLAETGRVSRACEYAGMSESGAYALRARDPLFAAGWDAACVLARPRLADALYEKAIDGVTDTITKDGEVVAQRHRFDSRLSIAVLNRLDKRCDRAAETGARHLAVAANWGDWLDCIGRGDDQAAEVIVETPQHPQFPQLPEGENPTAAAIEEAESDPYQRCWMDEDGVWMTDLPPPADFTGVEQGKYGDFDYERDCTPEESELLEANAGASDDEDRIADEAIRDSIFAMLREAGEKFAEG